MKTKNKKKNLLILLFILLGVFAQGQEVVTIQKGAGEVKFDGVPDEPFWQTARLFDLTMHSPTYGDKPSEQAKVYLSYDDKYLWVSANLKYKDASRVVSTSKKRDEKSKNPDSFGIILDTYDDNENALAFFTMPAGQRIDYAVSNDAQEVISSYRMTNINYNWDTFWDVKTARSEDGWTVEMRIPFSSLQFQSVNNQVKMGLIINRTISYCNEVNTYPEVDPKYGTLAPQKPSLAQTIVLSGIEESKPVYIAPYVTAGISRLNELDETGASFDYSEDKTLTGGLDVKYSLTSNLTMDLTLNTDFSQVEADDEEVNLTRYALYYPEKRTFFQERASIFNFSLRDQSQLFYSRKIGLDDNGDPVQILGGARLTGRVGKWDMGFMDMQTQKSESLGSENFGVLRFRRQVFNTNSYVGAILTSRMGSGNTNDFSYGVDGVFRVFGDDYVQVNVAQVTSPEGENLTSSLDDAFFRFNWERRSNRGLAYLLSYSYAGEGFDPKVGFMTKYATKTAQLELQYGWLPEGGSKLFRYSAKAYVYKEYRVTGNKLETASYGPVFSFVTKSGWAGKIRVFYYFQGVDNPFELADNVVVPANEYKYVFTKNTFSSPSSKPVSTELEIMGGQYYDGKNLSITAEPVFNLSASVQLSAYYNFNHVEFSERGQEMYAHIGRVRFLYMFNTKLSASAFVQYNSNGQLTISNFRLRYNPREGTDLYLVYNEIRPTSGYFDNGIPKVKILDQTVQVKFVHTLKL